MKAISHKLAHRGLLSLEDPKLSAHRTIVELHQNQGNGGELGGRTKLLDNIKDHLDSRVYPEGPVCPVDKASQIGPK